MQPIWNKLRHIFEHDDHGTLPEIFIEPLTGAETVEMYRNVMSQAEILDDPMAWTIPEEHGIPLKQLNNAAELVVEGKILSLSHGLADLKIRDVTLPQLNIWVQPGAVSFDYRMGPEWGPNEVEALFEFLWGLVQNIPTAKVFRAEEGCYFEPTEEFTRVWNEYAGLRRQREV